MTGDVCLTMTTAFSPSFRWRIGCFGASGGRKTSTGGWSFGRFCSLKNATFELKWGDSILVDLVGSYNVYKYLYISWIYVWLQYDEWDIITYMMTWRYLSNDSVNEGAVFLQHFGAPSLLWGNHVLCAFFLVSVHSNVSTCQKVKVPLLEEFLIATIYVYSIHTNPAYAYIFTIIYSQYLATI